MNNVLNAPIDTARNDIASQQGAFAKKRGRAALRGLVVDTFIAAETLIGTLSVEDQVLLLDEHQVKPATVNTSPYSPWIAVLCGEPDNSKPKVLDLNDVERPRWVPDKSMAVYFHTMEALHEKGYSAKSSKAEMIAYLTSEGGAQTVANKRKAAKNSGKKPGGDKTDDERRDLYLSEGPQHLVGLEAAALDLPDDAGKFVSIIVERRDDGQLLYRGVHQKDALTALNKLAGQKYEALTQQREQRKVIDLAVEKARKEAREEALAELKAGAQG